MPINIPHLKVDGTFPRVPLGGIYFISNSPNVTQSTTIKIGKSINLKQRLNSYHICFPHGFFIHALIIGKQTSATIRKERTNMTKELERAVFEDIKQHHPNARMTQLTSGAREAFHRLSYRAIVNIVKRVQRSHAQYVDVKKTHIGDRISSIMGNDFVASVSAKDYKITDESVSTSKVFESVFGDEVKAIDRAVLKWNRAELKRKPRPKPLRTQPARAETGEALKRENYRRLKEAYIDKALKRSS